MDYFIKECEETVSQVKKLLNENPEWIQRYANYAKLILKRKDELINKKTRFREWKPLYLYMPVGEAKGKMAYSLRFLGQDVAKLKVKKENITISTKGFNGNNLAHFDCDIKLDELDWKSREASEFRKHFSNKVKVRNNIGKKNEEHRIESLLLSEFSKSKSPEKKLLRIQPVRFGGHARFQLLTPLKASDVKALAYSGPNGGGIDIISRVGTGKATKLCIMEVKDENVDKEPPTTVIQQGLAYATFIRELLRSKSGKGWWEIFGYSGNVPAELEIYVVNAMPFSITNNNTDFENMIIKAEKDCKSEYSGDRFKLHYLYFHQQNNHIDNISTSLAKCIPEA